MTVVHPLIALQRRVRVDGSQPGLTWIGPEGERIELSLASLWNYACKAANLLGGELEVEPGDALCINLPRHWQTAGLVLGAWAVGAVITDGECVCCVTTTAAVAAVAPGTTAVLATSLDALGAPSREPLPAGVLDVGRELRMQPDSLAIATDWQDTASAVFIGYKAWTFAELFRGQLPTAAGLASENSGENVNVRTGMSSSVAGASVLPTTIDVQFLHQVVQMCNSGSLVIAPDPSDPKVTTQERIDVWV
jgi:uncharacterized protein (TIGR03089 family)